MLQQFEAEMALADVTGGIGFELRGVPLPRFDRAAFTQCREKWCSGLIDGRMQIVHVRNRNTGAVSREQIAVGINVKMGGRLEYPTTGIAAELIDRMPP